MVATTSHALLDRELLLLLVVLAGKLCLAIDNGHLLLDVAVSLRLKGRGGRDAMALECQGRAKDPLRTFMRISLAFSLASSLMKSTICLICGATGCGAWMTTIRLK